MEIQTKKGKINAARIFEAIGKIGYSPESAILDIVDNSVNIIEPLGREKTRIKFIKITYQRLQIVFQANAKNQNFLLKNNLSYLFHQQIFQ